MIHNIFCPLFELKAEKKMMDEEKQREIMIPLK